MPTLAPFTILSHYNIALANSSESIHEFLITLNNSTLPVLYLEIFRYIGSAMSYTKLLNVSENYIKNQYLFTVYDTHWFDKETEDNSELIFFCCYSCVFVNPVCEIQLIFNG